MATNQDKVKSSVDFLKHDTNLHHDYQLIRNNKKVYNFEKKKIYSTTHSTKHDFMLIPKNNIPDKPWTGSTWYADFELPRFNYSISEFVLTFRLVNYNYNNLAYCLNNASLIDRVAILKNSNELGNSLPGDGIFYYNLNKIYNKDFCDNKNSTLTLASRLRMTTEETFVNGFLNSDPIAKNSKAFPYPSNAYDAALELPISLAHSNILT